MALAVNDQQFNLLDKLPIEMFEQILLSLLASPARGKDPFEHIQALANLSGTSKKIRQLIVDLFWNKVIRIEISNGHTFHLIGNKTLCRIMAAAYCDVPYDDDPRTLVGVFCINNSTYLEEIIWKAKGQIPEHSGLLRAVAKTPKATVNRYSVNTLYLSSYTQLPFFERLELAFPEVEELTINLDPLVFTERSEQDRDTFLRQWRILIVGLFYKPRQIHTVTIHFEIQYEGPRTSLIVLDELSAETCRVYRDYHCVPVSEKEGTVPREINRGYLTLFLNVILT